MKASSSERPHNHSVRRGFTLIELLVVIAIIAILAVVVVLTLNPAQLLAQSRDANRVSDMATLSSALNLYTTDQTGASSFSLGNASNTGISIFDPNGSSTCGSLGLPSFTSGSWYCSTSTSSRNISGSGWIPVNFSNISAGSPIGSLPVDPVNQTSTSLFYAYNTNGSQFEVTADLESQKYKTQYGNTPQTSYFPEVISGGTPTLSALYNPSGLVGYWPMDEGSGSTTIDQSGNGANGTWSGAPIGNNGTYYAGGKVGTYAADLDGSSDQISVTSSTALQGAANGGTISAWVNEASSSPALGAIFDYGGTGGSNGLVLWGTTTGSNKAELQYGYGGSNTATIFSGTLSINTWYFITATWGSIGGRLYVNGMLQGSVASSSEVTALSPMYIGSQNSTRYLAGAIDDLRTYNRILSPAEIMALYNTEK
jgi:prepilin-type N-terminal cleavage/methylation domain-containing protein